MAYCKVIRPFSVALESGAVLSFRRGDEFVPDIIADHPLVVSNTVGPDEELPEEVEASAEERQPVLPEGAIKDEAPEAPVAATGGDEAPAGSVGADQSGEGAGEPGNGPHEGAGEADPVAETLEEMAKDAELAADGVSKDDLIAKAASLDVSIDKRWGIARIQAAIDAAKG